MSRTAEPDSDGFTPRARAAAAAAADGGAGGEGALGAFDGPVAAPARLVDGVLSQLSAAILDGRIRPGEPLPGEQRMADRFGVSKQVVREAVSQLAGQGVLEVGQGKATRVRAQMDAEPLSRFWRFAVGTTREGVAEAVELRRMIEPPAARLAAARATEEGVAELRRLLGAMEAAVGDPEAWLPADMEFHEQVARMSANRLVLLHVRAMRPVVEPVMAAFNARPDRTAADWRTTVRRHARIFEAVAARDPDIAEAAMLAHFAEAESTIARLYPAPRATAAAATRGERNDG